MVIELVRIWVRSGKREELGKAMLSLIEPIQAQHGCLSCGLYEAWPMGDELQIGVRWERQENLIAHLQSESFKKVLLLAELSAAPPVLEFFAVAGSRGLDLVETARTPQK